MLTPAATFQAIQPLLDREAAGIVHLLLSASLKATPLAALSRPVAGTIKNTLITTLPGSVKAVTENINALLQAGVVNHAIELIRGGKGQGVHASLAAEGIRIAGDDSVASASSTGRAPSVGPAPSTGLGPSPRMPTPRLPPGSPGSLGTRGGHHHHHHDHDHGHDHGHSIPQPRSVLSHDPTLPGRPYWKQVEHRTKRRASSSSSCPPQGVTVSPSHGLGGASHYPEGDPAVACVCRTGQRACDINALGRTHPPLYTRSRPD